MEWTEPQRIAYVLEASAWCVGVMGALWAWTRHCPVMASAIQRPSACFVALFLATPSSGYHGPAPLLMLVPLALYPLVSPKRGRNHASRFLALAWGALFTVDQVALFQWWRYRRALPEWMSTALWFAIVIIVPALAVTLKVRDLRHARDVADSPVVSLRLGEDGA